MAVITGTDDLSLSIMDALERGEKVKDIPGSFHVSLDQAKRLSRLHNLLKEARINLSDANVSKIESLGVKVFQLAPLFKDKDWEGLSEILSSLHADAKREELPQFIEALYEKRRRVAEFQREVDLKMQSLKRRETELEALEQELSHVQQKIEEETRFLSKYPEEARPFLIKHLGIFEGKLVLSRRLDSRWQKLLKQKNVLEYDEWNYIWLVRDLDRFVEEYLARAKRNKPLATEWDYEKEQKRAENSWWGYDAPTDPEYQLPDGLATDLRSNFAGVELRMNEIKSERESIQKEMKQLRRASPRSFMESVEAANTLSVHELKTHGELQDKALKWLFNKGFIVASEITLPNGKRADVVGYDDAGRIVIIEVKVSVADFRKDDKWQTYLDYCDEFYFLMRGAVVVNHYHLHAESSGAGLLKEDKNSLKIDVHDTIQHQVRDREHVYKAINKLLARKYVFGY